MPWVWGTQNAACAGSPTAPALLGQLTSIPTTLSYPTLVFHAPILTPKWLGWELSSAPGG